MSTEDNIKLMELLQEYIKECESERKQPYEIETKEQLATQIMIADHIKVSREIIEVLCYKL